MPKQFEHGLEGEIQSNSKCFSVPKMELDFPNIDWDVRSLGH